MRSRSGTPRETAAQALFGNGHNGGPPLDGVPTAAAATVLDRELDLPLGKGELAWKLRITQRTLDRWGAAGLAPPRVILPGRRVAFRPNPWPNGYAIWKLNRDRSTRVATCRLS
jgi:hypothetical protein